jgi:glycosyltransferase involved in cell wall biosynthesis
MDFLCISTTDWDEIWGSRQQIMLRLAKSGNRVLFVERQLGPEHILKAALQSRRRKPSKESRLVQIGPSLWRWRPPIMIPGRYYSTGLNLLGQRRLAGQVKTILREIDFKNPILWLYPPHSEPLIGSFQERLAVYHCIENFSGDQSGLKRRVMISQETRLLGKADLLIVHSLGLQKRYAPLTRSPIRLIPSAADVEFFQSISSIHPEIEAISHPRLVMVGTLDSRLDLNLLREIVDARPDWHLVLVGKLMGKSRNIKSLARRSNVHYLGYRSYVQLPSILNGADVTLIPYRLTEMTRYINPLKAYEYLAAGKPIVSVDLPELAPLADWTQIIPGKNEEDRGYADRFVEGIRSVLASDSPVHRAERRRAASNYNWDERVDQIMQLIREWLH